MTHHQPEKDDRNRERLGHPAFQPCAIGCTPNAMKAAITKIAMVCGMCRASQRASSSTTTTAGPDADPAPECGVHSALQRSRRSVWYPAWP